MSFVKEEAGVYMVAGTPKEIKTRLGRSEADQVMMFSFEHIADTEELQALIENMATLTATMFGLLKARQTRESLEQLVGALLPPAPASPRLLKEAAMLIQARRAVLDSGHWLTAAQLAQLAGLSTTNPSAQPNKWKKSGQIFAIHHNGVDYFPDYGLDQNTNFRPLKALTSVIEVFAEHKDGWGMAFWFLSVNSFLGGKRPQDLLATEPERVMAAAMDEVEGAVHG